MRIALATLLCVSACTSVVQPPPLSATQWRVAAINGRATPAAPNYRMEFRDGSLGGQFGCNHFGGEYRVSGDTLTSGAVVMTEMACSEPADSFEGWGLAIIQRPMRIVWEDVGHVRLSNEAGSVDLRR